MHGSTRVFVSATSADLGSVRKVVKDALLAIDCHPVEQTTFPPDHRSVHEMLQEKIRSCQAVVHIVGMRYGSEPDPDQLPDGEPRRSFTQWEYHYAQSLNKKLYVFVCPPNFPYDDCEAESGELQSLQQAHRDRVAETKLHRTEVVSPEDVARRARELQLELQSLRAHVHRTRQWMFAAVAALMCILAAIALLIVHLTGLVGGASDQVSDVQSDVAQLERSVEDLPGMTIEQIAKLYEDPDVLTGKLKSHIRQRADQEIATAKSAAQGWRKIDEIEKQRDAALARVDDLVHTIREGLSGDPDPIFAQAARILAEQGVDETLAYLLQKEPEIEQRVDRLKRRRDDAEEDLRDALETWLFQAALYESDLSWTKSLQYYRRVCDITPRWSRARRRLGILLVDLTRFAEAESHLLAARQNASDQRQQMLAANDLGYLYLGRSRWQQADSVLNDAYQLAQSLQPPDPREMATVLSNIAMVRKQTHQLREAEAMLIRSLELSETTLSPSHELVAASLGSLAQVVQSTDRLKAAEMLFTRALVIDQKAFGQHHPSVARDLGNLAVLMHQTNRIPQARALMRGELKIYEDTYGTDHPTVARSLNNLGQLLKKTGQLAESESLLRMALAIDERTYGSSHPSVARDLSNLAVLLFMTQRMPKAEPLMRCALAIHERHNGPLHTSVATDISNLALLLKYTQRLSEAEPLMRRSLEIDMRTFGSEHTGVAIKVNNLATLLLELDRPEEAELLLRHALAVDESTYGPEHPNVARDLGNLATVLKATARFDDAEMLMRRELEIHMAFITQTSRQHPKFRAALENYAALGEAMGLSEAEITQQLDQIKADVRLPFSAIAPKVQQLLGTPQTLREILAKLDQRHRNNDMPDLYFLALEEPINPHLNTILGPAELQSDSEQSLASQVERWLGPAPWAIQTSAAVSDQLDARLGARTPVDSVLQSLRLQQRDPAPPWQRIMDLDQPIAPHFGQIL